MYHTFLNEMTKIVRANKRIFKAQGYTHLRLYFETSDGPSPFTRYVSAALCQNALKNHPIVLNVSATLLKGEYRAGASSYTHVDIALPSGTMYNCINERDEFMLKMSDSFNWYS